MNININNYEEWMIDYIEGNLSAAQEKELNEFLVFHPELKADLELFSATKLQPDMHVVFADKNSLKKETAGRVITMFSWVKYSAAVAAAIMVFVGVRLYNGNNNDQQMAIKKYQYENTTGQYAFDRNVDSIKELPAVNEQPKNYDKQFANQEQDKLPVEKNNIPEKQIKREINPIQKIDYAKAIQLKLEKNKNNNQELVPETVEPIYANNAQVNQPVKVTNVTDISLNDNKTVVDWWIDAVAIGDEVGAVIEDVKDYDLNPIKPFLKDDNTAEKVKTKNINILGFNYYSRKKTNN